MSHLIWLLMDFNKPNLAVMDVVREQPSLLLRSDFSAVMIHSELAPEVLQFRSRIDR